jgi:hypothetical protein
MNKNNLFQFRAEKPSIEWITKTFNIKASSIDENFGIICTDSIDNLHTVMVDDLAMKKIENKMKKLTQKHPAEGFFSNPTIEPF